MSALIYGPYNPLHVAVRITLRDGTCYTYLHKSRAQGVKGARRAAALAAVRYADVQGWNWETVEVLP